ncbi:IS3 family transposase [Paenibacillus thiaminolyticus]|uniref:IS3 family transposase n=1 Tax=Paenibacillus thiaminolyticus TaxID=49283 RepID=UPI0035A6AAC3
MLVYYLFFSSCHVTRLLVWFRFRLRDLIFIVLSSVDDQGGGTTENRGSYTFFNHERIQRKLNKLAPVEYRNQLASRGLFNVYRIGA